MDKYELTGFLLNDAGEDWKCNHCKVADILEKYYRMKKILSTKYKNKYKNNKKKHKQLVNETLRNLKNHVKTTNPRWLIVEWRLWFHISIESYLPNLAIKKIIRYYYELKKRQENQEIQDKLKVVEEGIFNLTHLSKIPIFRGPTSPSPFFLQHYGYSNTNISIRYSP